MASRVRSELHSFLAHVEDLVPGQWLHLFVRGRTLLPKTFQNLGLLFDQADGEKKCRSNPVGFEYRKCEFVVVRVPVVERQRHHGLVACARDGGLVMDFGKRDQAGTVLEPGDLGRKQLWSCRGKLLRRMHGMIAEDDHTPG